MSVCAIFFYLCTTQETVEKVDNSKSSDARVIELKHYVSPYHTLSLDEVSLK